MFYFRRLSFCLIDLMNVTVTAKKLCVASDGLCVIRNISFLVLWFLASELPNEGDRSTSIAAQQIHDDGKNLLQ